MLKKSKKKKRSTKLPKHIAKVLSRLKEPKQTFKSSERTQWRALCPAHKDTAPSLSISLEKDGRILLYCHGGCEIEEILEAMGLHYRHLLTEKLWIKRYGFNHTDAGNARRFAMQHKGKILYCWDWKRWLVYDGKKWNLETGEARAIQFAVETARSILDEIRKDQEPKIKEKIMRWAFKSESDYEIKAMLRMARAQSDICVYSKEFDQEDYLLNCRNGTVDLTTGILKRHDSEDYITQIVSTTYPAEFGEVAKVTPRNLELWYELLQQWMLNNKSQVNYLKRLAGYCLSGSISYRVFPVFYGTGKNGKNTFLDTLAQIMGDYAGKAPETLLKHTKFTQHPTEIADLEGKRLVVASETHAHMKLRIPLVKEITGDRTIKGRGMRQDFHDIRQTAKVILMTQNLPRIDEQTNAIWDRVHLVEWKYRVPEKKEDTELLKELQTEWPWILAWAIRGYMECSEKSKLIPTETIRKAVQRYRKQENPGKEFADENFKRRIDKFVTNTRMTEVYQFWVEDCRRHGRYFVSLSKDALSKSLKQLGYKQEVRTIKGKTQRCWLNIVIKNE